MRRRRNPTSRESLFVVGGVAAAVYLIYQWLKKPSPNSPTTIAANAIAGAINLWNRLVVSPPMGGVKGDVLLPDGTDIGPLSGMTIRTDPGGNVYTLVGSDLYQIGQSDANGNWPVQLVLDTSFGVTGGGW